MAAWEAAFELKYLFFASLDADKVSARLLRHHLDLTDLAKICFFTFRRELFRVTWTLAYSLLSGMI
jgi:hypothetical protein